jgi:hypothetical protein
MEAALVPNSVVDENLGSSPGSDSISGRLKHPGPLAGAESHSQKEKEQEAVVSQHILLIDRETEKLTS